MWQSSALLVCSLSRPQKKGWTSASSCAGGATALATGWWMERICTPCWQELAIANVQPSRALSLCQDPQKFQGLFHQPRSLGVCTAWSTPANLQTDTYATCVTCKPWPLLQYTIALDWNKRMHTGSVIFPPDLLSRAGVSFPLEGKKSV